MSKKVDYIITGGDGFIAKNLINSISKKKKIYVLNKAKGNLCNKKTWKKLPRCQVLLHLAGKSYVPDSWKNHFKFIKNNINSTKNALQYCKENDAKLVFASTNIYEYSKKKKLNEKSKLNPKNPYQISKFLCEELCRYHNINFKTKILILRIFNSYGKHQAKKFLIPQLILMIKKGKIILKNPNLSRDFIYIKDLVRAINISLDKTFNFKILNIGSGKSKKIKNILKIILDEMNINKKNIKIKYLDKKYKNNLQYYANISEAKKFLNWSPEFSFTQGIKDLIKNK